MLEWVEAVENQEDPLLDEAGDPQRPSRFIIEAIEEDEAHPQQGHSTNTDSSSSTDNGGDAGESYVSTTQVEGGAWTDEQYFTYATQDIDHRARQGTGHVYTRKGKGKGKEKAVDEFEHMRQSLQGAYIEQSSSYSQPSYYGESYGQQQYSDSWSFFSQQQYDTEQQIHRIEDPEPSPVEARRLYRSTMLSRPRFAISTCTARYGRYIPVRQVTGTRIARYRAVPSKIGRRRSIE
ncbi:hypothetical protein B296_00014619 [Ensete ventricosum]|uniref:Uncharacterized protein n=1 Tax=Ensete ventricosum TaxID=4639 RepID=A0A427A9U9_ENSVE|nr:hypothetical protein B296_00014619 [Ensete ventricosum]